MSHTPKPVLLIVMDGFGISLSERGDATHEARKPNLDYIEKCFPLTTLQASAVAVGLPWGEAGNSEVGHLTMGTGRVIYHHLPRIIVAIHDGSFYQNPALMGVVNHVKSNNSALHLLGLVSSGSVHSYIDHLYALLDLAEREKVPRVFLHAITDGKDAPPQEAAVFMAQIEERLNAKYPAAIIASLVGRFYAMDRDKKWDRIRRTYRLLTAGEGTPFQQPSQYIEQSYERGVYDEYVEPAYLEKDGQPLGRVSPRDGLVMFNFREDSMREIAEAFVANNFMSFKRIPIPELKVATMTEYEKNLPGAEAAFKPLEVNWPLARVLAVNAKKQLHVAESEKYAHVTYFFNGGMEKPFPGEDRLLIPSSGVPHFDEHPEMKAREITEKIIERISSYDFVLGNFANTDVVGHTGNFEAAIKAVEVVDECVGRIMSEILKSDGVMLLTGDHGNIEQKIHPISGEPLTEHTTNPVPFYLIAKNYRLRKERRPEEIKQLKKETGGILVDVAPTILELMSLPKPQEMTGQSLMPLLIHQI